ncbi:PAS domain-containing protein [Streptomyces sp. NPDC057684]|uniref:PAS domain-containing protein n=1 Tax=Streptomyces sp. NPDC057684 TaxID=3346211 RepID=UPI0036CFE906
MDGQGRGQGWVGAGERTYGFWGPRWRVGKLAAGDVHGAAFVDSEGGISLWSPQAEALFGYPAEEVCGTPAVDLLTPRRTGKRYWPPATGRRPGRTGSACYRNNCQHALRVRLSAPRSWWPRSIEPSEPLR